MFGNGQSSNDVHSSIRSRLDGIRAECAKLEARLSTLRQEEEELGIAFRVVARVMGLSPSEMRAELHTKPGTVSKDQSVPTMPEMICEVVGELTGIAQSATNLNIVSRIGERWGLHDPNAIRPTVWRMWKSGRLIKQGDGYRLPRSSDQPPSDAEIEAASADREDAA